MTDPNETNLERERKMARIKIIAKIKRLKKHAHYPKNKAKKVLIK